MKLLFFIIGTLLSPLVPAATPSPVIPQNQYLAAVEYGNSGEQTGCGLRTTGETREGLRIDMLLNVFVKDFGEMFGMFKVVIRKASQLDGQSAYPKAWKIYKAWIKTGTGLQPLVHEGRESPHSDGYMAKLEFDNAMELLVAISQEDFRLVYNRQENGPEEAFQFNRRITPREAGRLSSCMENLRMTRSGESGKAL